MDQMNPNLHKKFKSPVRTKACETCMHSEGDFFEDPENEERTRVFCKARYNNVIVEDMAKYCDFYTYDSDKKVVIEEDVEDKKPGKVAKETVQEDEDTSFRE